MGRGERRGPPAAAYLDGIRCSHLVAPFPKEMVPLGLLVGFCYLVEAQMFCILHVGREAGLLSRVGGLPHSFGFGPPCIRAPRRGRGARGRGRFPGKRTRGWCLRLLAARSGTPRAHGPQGIQARTSDNEVGACGGIVFASHCKEKRVMSKSEKFNPSCSACLP